MYKGVKILIVDDNPGDTDLLLTALENIQSILEKYLLS